MEQFADKVVWITGASSGIGEALTYELNKKGSQLIISSRKETELNAVKARCEHPQNVAVLSLDLSDFEGMGDIVSRAIKHLWKGRYTGEQCWHKSEVAYP